MAPTESHPSQARRRHPRRLWLAAPVAALGLLLSACGAGGSSAGAGTATTSGGPAANIDPNSHGVITGPINQARTTASSVDQQQDQQQLPSGG